MTGDADDWIHCRKCGRDYRPGPNAHVCFVHPLRPSPSIQRHAPMLETDAKARKEAPVARGVLDYFPNALLAVAELSRIGNEQHNPGQPMHWAKEKSTDHADCIVRHLMERGTIDTDGIRHSAKVAWRALALLQIEIENDLKNSPVARTEA